MNYIARNLEKVILQVSDEYPVVLVTGPRQVGKTTMLQKLMEGTGRKYVSLDDLNERSLAKTDPELFLQLHKPPVLIDEVQYAPELFIYIKIHVDKTHNPGDFWLTIFERIFKGSLPALISGQNSNSQIFYSSYLSTYIERDIRELSDSIDSLKFLKFITAVTARSGQMLNMADRIHKNSPLELQNCY